MKRCFALLVLSVFATSLLAQQEEGRGTATGAAVNTTGKGYSAAIVVERSAIRGKKGLCKSMRDLAIKSRVLGDGVYYIPIELWPNAKGPVTVHKHDWTVIGSIPRTSRAAKKRVKEAV